MSRVNMRPRQIDVHKKLQIVRVEDITFEANGQKVSVSASRPNEQKVAKKKIFIPTPVTKAISNYDDLYVKPRTDKFGRPKHYIKVPCTACRASPSRQSRPPPLRALPLRSH